MSKFKLVREITSSTKEVELTDEIYTKLSRGNKVLVNLAEGLKIKVMISFYNENPYLTVETIDTLVAKLFE